MLPWTWLSRERSSLRNVFAGRICTAFQRVRKMLFRKRSRLFRNLFVARLMTILAAESVYRHSKRRCSLWVGVQGREVCWHTSWKHLCAVLFSRLNRFRSLSRGTRNGLFQVSVPTVKMVFQPNFGRGHVKIYPTVYVLYKWEINSQHPQLWSTILTLRLPD